MREGNGDVELVEAEPLRLEVCPVHDRVVMMTASGHFVRRCAECVIEAEQGLEILAEIRRQEEQG